VISCGGLIELARLRGATVHVTYVVIGTSRQLVTGATNPVPRKAEMAAVSRAAGFSYDLLYEGEEFLRLDVLPQVELVNRVEDRIEAFRPDIVVIPPGSSYDQDHRALHTACLTALRPIPADLRHFVPVVLMCEEPYAWGTSDHPRPNVYFDLSRLESTKATLMKLHATQDRQEPFCRSGANLTRLLRVRGTDIGRGAAEAYVLLRGVFGWPPEAP
jgi:N-acetylglucosamine malate deacetylase 1